MPDTLPKESIKKQEARNMKTTQNFLFEINERTPTLQKAMRSLSEAEAYSSELGAIFTRREVVDFMLDLLEYVVEKDLVHTTLLEPACGQGDFLLAALERLLTSYILHNYDPKAIVSLLQNAIRAVELHKGTFEGVKSKVLKLLKIKGVEWQDSLDLVNTWFINDDFLLTDIPLKFTHIVENPPYVRQELIDDVLIAEYRKRYKTIYDRADLYIPFIEHSLSLLKATGKLCVICPDRWMKNRYGGPLRDFISAKFSLQCYIDMTKTDAFQKDVVAYPAITMLTRQKSPNTYVVRHPQLDATFFREVASTITNQRESYPNQQVQILKDIAIGAGPWIFKSSIDEQDLLDRLEREFVLIEDSGCKVGIGVATGCDKVFIGRKNDLPVEEDRKIPLLMTSDIQEGEIIWSGTTIINPFDINGKLISLDNYPQLKDYFMQKEPALRKRHVAKKNQNSWYRTIDKINESFTYQPKLLIPDIKGEPLVVYDQGNYYPHHNLYYITSSEWDLQSLQAILRSSITKFFVATYSVKMRGDYLRFQAQNLRKIRVPLWKNVSNTQHDRLKKAVSLSDLNTCNEIVFELYQFSAGERKAIQKYVKNEGAKH